MCPGEHWYPNSLETSETQSAALPNAESSTERVRASALVNGRTKSDPERTVNAIAFHPADSGLSVRSPTELFTTDGLNHTLSAIFGTEDTIPETDHDSLTTDLVVNPEGKLEAMWH